MEAASQERLIFATSTHWMKYVSTLLIAHVFVAVGIGLVTISFFTVRTAENIAYMIFLMGTLLVFFSHHHLFLKLLSEAMIDIIVTNDRIIYFDDYLFVCDDEHEIPVHKITAVEVQQHGIAQNVLNYGILWFDTGGGAIDIKRSIPYVPNPDEIAGRITVLIREQRNYDIHS